LASEKFDSELGNGSVVIQDPKNEARSEVVHGVNWELEEGMVVNEVDVQI